MSKEKIVEQVQMEYRYDDHCDVFGGFACEEPSCHGGYYYPKLKKFVEGMNTWSILAPEGTYYQALHCEDCHGISFIKDKQFTKQPTLEKCVLGHRKWYEEARLVEELKTIKAREKIIREPLRVHCEAITRETAIDPPDTCFVRSCHDVKMSERPDLAFSKNKKKHCETCHGLDEKNDVDACVDYHRDMLRRARISRMI